jgi:hypothetical protein
MPVTPGWAGIIEVVATAGTCRLARSGSSVAGDGVVESGIAEDLTDWNGHDRAVRHVPNEPDVVCGFLPLGGDGLRGATGLGRVPPPSRRRWSRSGRFASISARAIAGGADQGAGLVDGE